MDVLPPGNGRAPVTRLQSLQGLSQSLNASIDPRLTTLQINGGLTMVSTTSFAVG